jgi:hypothetical protein
VAIIGPRNVANTIAAPTTSEATTPARATRSAVFQPESNTRLNPEKGINL